MRRLFYTQACYYYEIIKKRFWGLTGAYLIIVIGYFGRLPRRRSLLNTILTGPDFEAIKQGYPYLPPFWLMIMILPAFIIGDSFGAIQAGLFSKAKGLGFSKREFGLNNLLLITATNLCYLATILIALLMAEVTTAGSQGFMQSGWPISYQDLGLRLFLILMLLSLIQQICGWLNRVLLLLVPMVALVYTDFTVAMWNPLNLVLWPRMRLIGNEIVTLTIVGCLMLAIGYGYVYGKYELK